MVNFNYRNLIMLSIFMHASPLHCLKIDRVILATDDNPNYIQFWPIVAKVWKDVIGVQPTLALIADKSVVIDESLGDVIRFEPIPGIPTSTQAQVIRLLLPAYFEDDGCIISDIDMIPISKDFLINTVATIPEDNFVVYRSRAYEKKLRSVSLETSAEQALIDEESITKLLAAENEIIDLLLDDEDYKPLYRSKSDYHRFSMCYNAAKGKTFKEIFRLKDVQEIPERIKQWHALGLGWGTDEMMLTREVLHWRKSNKPRCTLLDLGVNRINSRLTYDVGKLKKHRYTDSSLPRPYNAYKAQIDLLASYL